jgi:hypothetical protein
MFSVLRLWRIQFDGDRLLRLVHFIRLPERLIPAGNHLDTYVTLRQSRNLRHTVLIGADLPVSNHLLTQLGDGAALDEIDHDSSPLNGFATMTEDFHLDASLVIVRMHRNARRTEDGEKGETGQHYFIINIFEYARLNEP